MPKLSRSLSFVAVGCAFIAAACSSDDTSSTDSDVYAIGIERLDVDSTGNLYVGGVNLDTGQVWCDRSTNARMASATPTFSARR